MKEKICIDTDILIDYLRSKQKSEYLDKIFNGDIEGYLTSVNMFELNIGVTNKKQSQDIRDIVSYFQILNFDVKASQIASDIFISLKNKGFMTDFRDIFIASCCISNNIPLVTRNIKHFENINSLKIKK